MKNIDFKFYSHNDVVAAAIYDILIKADNIFIFIVSESKLHGVSAGCMTPARLLYIYSLAKQRAPCSKITNKIESIVVVGVFTQPSIAISAIGRFA